MEPSLLRLRVADGALPDVQAWFSDDSPKAAIIEVHRMLDMWVEHIFLGECEGRWYVYSYMEADDPTTVSERSNAIDTPEFTPVRETFSSMFDQAVRMEYQTSVLVDKP
jgi:hypothetical protein